MSDFEKALREKFTGKAFTGRDVIEHIELEALPPAARYAVQNLRRRGMHISVGKALANCPAAYRLGGRSGGQTLWMLYQD